MREIGMDVETQDNRIWCLGLGQEHHRTASQDWRPLLHSVLDAGYLPVFQNAKFDMARIEAEERVQFRDWRDTILEAHFLGVKPLNLPSMSSTFLGVELDKTFVKESRAKGKNRVTFDDRPQETLEGCSLDAWATYRIRQKFGPKVEAQYGALYAKEREVTRILMQMEATGLPLSQEKLRQARITVMRRMGQLENELLSYGIEEPGKREAVAQKFWRGKKQVVTTKSGELSTTAETLRKYATPEDVPWVEAFIAWHQLAKFKSTYIENWMGHEWLHPSLNQTGTATWRFSCSNPNLQNITKDKGVPLFQLFVAPEGWVFISGDYDQLELRHLANEANDRPLIELFLAGGDPHDDTIRRVGYMEKYGDYEKARRYAKVLNFGIPYGMSGYAYAAKTGMTEEEGDAFVRGWYEAHPAVYNKQQEWIAHALAHGYVTTHLGRPLWVPGIYADFGRIRAHAERQCMNYPIQGGAAEIVKDAMLRAPDYLVMQVHDELLYLVPEEIAEEYCQYLNEVLPDRSREVPYTIECHIGKTWGDIKNIDDIWVEDEEEDDDW